MINTISISQDPFSLFCNKYTPSLDNQAGRWEKISHDNGWKMKEHFQRFSSNLSELDRLCDQIMKEGDIKLIVPRLRSQNYKCIYSSRQTWNGCLRALKKELKDCGIMMQASKELSDQAIMSFMKEVHPYTGDPGFEVVIVNVSRILKPNECFTDRRIEIGGEIFEENFIGVEFVPLITMIPWVVEHLHNKNGSASFVLSGSVIEHGGITKYVAGNHIENESCFFISNLIPEVNRTFDVRCPTFKRIEIAS